MLASSEPSARARFVDEARAMAELRHPNVVAVFEAGEAGGRPYLAAELVAGESLEESVTRGGPLEPERAVEVTLALWDALEAAHGRGILHRDVKPENVLLTAEGTPKLTDFGLARLAAREQRLTQTGEVLGTPGYMPPEQASGEKRRQGPVSDVYGLGATLYYLLSGRAPFEGPSRINLLKAVLTDDPTSLRKHVPGLDPPLEAVVRRALEKEPDGPRPMHTPRPAATLGVGSWAP